MSLRALIGLSLLMIVPSVLVADDAPRPKLIDGSAVVRVDDAEYKILIRCDDASRPELGFSTEPNRITRAANGGRYNMVNLRLRSWKDTGDVIISLAGYVSWIPQPASAGGTLSLKLDMSPIKVVRDDTPVLLTYDMWTKGDRPPGRKGVEIEAQCGQRDPEAPSYRRIKD
jgi:hypothetical protein